MARTTFEEFSGGQPVIKAEPRAREDISVNKTPFSNRITNFLGLGGATKTFGDYLARKGIGTDATKEVTEEFVEKPSGKQLGGALAQVGAVAAGGVLGTPAKLAGKAALGGGLGYAYDVGQDLIEGKNIVETLTPGMSTAIGATAPLVRPFANTTKSQANNIIPNQPNNAVPTPGNSNSASTAAKAIKQTTTDIAERVPRFIGRVSDDVKEQAAKAERIKNSPPLVQKALKVDLPEQFIDPVRNASPATKSAFRKVLDIADTPKSTLGQKSNPGIVAGELASKQYDLIENQRKTIGKSMNEVISGLSKTQPVPMRSAYQQLDSLLIDQDIIPKYTDNGVVLDFSKSKLAPKQRQVVSDLYKLSTEGGETLTPSQIHKKDQLFSALQRETRADQIEDVLIDLPDGNKMSMFRAFRDVYANELDNISPEIKSLNSKYRNVATLLEDIEDSIFKTPDFNITKTTDQAEFAKVNLRRIFGEAQSSPVYEAIADEMDSIAKLLGYSDASPKEVAAFAQEIRQLYPETVPKAGFQGGIMEMVGNVTGNLLQAGKADVADQRKALRALIEAND